MRKYQCDVSADNVPPVQSPAVEAPCRRDYQYHAFADHVRSHGLVTCCRSALQARLSMPRNRGQRPHPRFGRLPQERRHA